MAIPTDYLYKRKKIPEVQSARKTAAPVAAGAANVDAKKGPPITTNKTLKDKQKNAMREQNLDRIARENVEIHIEKEAVQNVEFDQLFTDNLP